MAGVSGKMVSVATASFLLGMLKAANLDLKFFLMVTLGRGGCPLCSIFKGFLYGVSIDPAKVWFELVIVYVCRFLGMFLDDMGGCPRKDRKGIYASVMDVTTFINSGVMLISA